jgi:HAE1 family hydrophobic/amphiphilic exporter-1
VIISAFNALTLSPALSALLLRPRRPARGPKACLKMVQPVFLSARRTAYVSVCGHAIRKAMIALILRGMGRPGPANSGSLSLRIPSEEDQGYYFMERPASGRPPRSNVPMRSPAGGGNPGPDAGVPVTTPSWASAC